MKLYLYAPAPGTRFSVLSAVWTPVNVWHSSLTQQVSHAASLPVWIWIFFNMELICLLREKRSHIC